MVLKLSMMETVQIQARKVTDNSLFGLWMKSMSRCQDTDTELRLCAVDIAAPKYCKGGNQVRPHKKPSAFAIFILITVT